VVDAEVLVNPIPTVSVDRRLLERLRRALEDAERQFLPAENTYRFVLPEAFDESEKALVLVGLDGAIRRGGGS
jgi:hypothetical protein